MPAALVAASSIQFEVKHFSVFCQTGPAFSGEMETSASICSWSNTWTSSRAASATMSAVLAAAFYVLFAAKLLFFLSASSGILLHAPHLAAGTAVVLSPVPLAAAQAAAAFPSYLSYCKLFRKLPYILLLLR
jgi:hypothetical protein